MSAAWKSVHHRLHLLGVQRGFSLVELSIVLVIVGIMVGGAIAPLGQTIKHARYKQTDKQLNQIREAIIGHLISTSRLPCPVNLLSQNTISPGQNESCQLQSGGVPAMQLGLIGEQSINGSLLDAWGRPYHYSVSVNDHAQLGQSGLADWLTVGELSAVGLANLSAQLQLCRAVSTNDCAKKDLVANQIVWVVHSMGENMDGTGLQSENTDRDNVFVVSAYSSNPQQPFDDRLIWGSRSEMVYWLLKANWLP